jgi:hypothetical protein
MEPKMRIELTTYALRVPTDETTWDALNQKTFKTI